jgi:hypothetical protein
VIVSEKKDGELSRREEERVEVFMETRVYYVLRYLIHKLNNTCTSRKPSQAKPSIT